MKLKLLFLLVYIASIISSVVYSNELVDLEKNESQIEIPPLNAISDNNIPNVPEHAVTEEIEAENVNNNARSDSSENSDNNALQNDSVESDLNKSESIQENLTIPVFSEWTQQQMQEAEKKLVELSNSTDSNKDTKNETVSKLQMPKMRQKNYASPDCGAKILAANPEAQSTSSVLSDKDEYMLSPCTDRIWFVIELCDSIQAQRVELANFELFSSPLKSVSISVSNRFPAREWTLAGQYDAKTDTRDIQVYDLQDVTLFGKFVRVDLQYINTEHYCPLSLFRIFGTSEIEAFEVENEPDGSLNSIDENEFMHNQNVDSKTEVKDKDNILNRAGAAVMSIVQKAAEVLVKGNGVKQNLTSTKLLNEKCMSMSHNILCEICSNDERLNLYDFIGCKNHELTGLLEHSNSQIRSHLKNSDVCHSILGFDLKSDSFWTPKNNFVISILPQKYIAALCNIIARDQNSLRFRIEAIPEITQKLVSKKDEESLKNVSKQEKHTDPQCNQQQVDISTTELPSENTTAKENETANADDLQKANETRLNKKHVPNDGQNIFNVVESLRDVAETPPKEINDVVNDKVDTDVNMTANNKDNTESKENISKKPDKKHQETVKNENSESKSQQLQKTTPHEQEVKQTESEHKSNGEQREKATAPESVFLRLSNRIKILEKNMTLSTQYLEELSRRYKKQIEDLQLSYTKLQNMFDAENSNKQQTQQRESEEKRQMQNDVNELINKAQYMEVILIVLSAFLVLQIILIIVLFKRLSMLQQNLIMNQDHNKEIVNTQNVNHVGDKARTGRKRSKQRVRKISAPNILSQRGINKNEFTNPPALSRTISAPNKIAEVKQAFPNGHSTCITTTTMLEENDEILLPGFEDLKISDEISPDVHQDFDTASTASVKTENSQKSFNFTRRLSSPTFLKLKKSSRKEERTKDSVRKAKSESPPKIIAENSVEIHKSNSFHIEDTESPFKFRKNNSFKKLFKKLF